MKTALTGLSRLLVSFLNHAESPNYSNLDSNTQSQVIDKGTAWTFSVTEKAVTRNSHPSAQSHTKPTPQERQSLSNCKHLWKSHREAIYELINEVFAARLVLH